MGVHGVVAAPRGSAKLHAVIASLAMVRQVVGRVNDEASYVAVWDDPAAAVTLQNEASGVAASPRQPLPAALRGRCSGGREREVALQVELSRLREKRHLWIACGHPSDTKRYMHTISDTWVAGSMCSAPVGSALVLQWEGPTVRPPRRRISRSKVGSWLEPKGGTAKAASGKWRRWKHSA